MSSAQSARTQNTSSSRKRSYDEYTRSESRSTSAEPISKRRRVHRTPVLSTTPQPTPQPARHERDGLDFRRPVMSNPARGVIVDLTGEDDDDDDLSEVLGFNDDHYFEGEDTPERLHIPESYVRQRRTPGDVDQSRLPLFQSAHGRPQNVIDLSDDEDVSYNPVPHAPQQPEPRRSSTSSDIVFVGERVATPAANPAPAHRRPSLRDRRPTPGPHRDRRLPRDMAAQPPLPGLGAIPNFLRRTTQTLFALAPPFLQPNPNDIPDNPLLNDDLEIVEFNYNNAAFPLGDRGSETPQATPGEAYREPPPVPEGFAGDIEEDGVYMCPRCDEELATGDTEEKQQVWVAKQCGHVYCGGCARARPLKYGTKKEKKASAREAPFRQCVVDGCGVKIDTKGAMIQVYL